MLPAHTGGGQRPRRIADFRQFPEQFQVVDSRGGGASDAPRCGGRPGLAVALQGNTTGEEASARMIR